jgi:hypothetical protein
VITRVRVGLKSKPIGSEPAGTRTRFPFTVI